MFFFSCPLKVSIRARLARAIILLHTCANRHKCAYVHYMHTFQKYIPKLSTLLFVLKLLLLRECPAKESYYVKENHIDLIKIYVQQLHASIISMLRRNIRWP